MLPDVFLINDIARLIFEYVPVGSRRYWLRKVNEAYFDVQKRIAELHKSTFAFNWIVASDQVSLLHQYPKLSLQTLHLQTVDVVFVKSQPCRSRFGLALQTCNFTLARNLERLIPVLTPSCLNLLLEFEMSEPMLKLFVKIISSCAYDFFSEIALRLSPHFLFLLQHSFTDIFVDYRILIVLIQGVTDAKAMRQFFNDYYLWESSILTTPLEVFVALLSRNMLSNQARRDFFDVALSMGAKKLLAVFWSPKMTHRKLTDPTKLAVLLSSVSYPLYLSPPATSYRNWIYLLLQWISQCPYATRRSVFAKTLTHNEVAPVRYFWQGNICRRDDMLDAMIHAFPLISSIELLQFIWDHAPIKAYIDLIATKAQLANNFVVWIFLSEKLGEFFYDFVINNHELMVRLPHSHDLFTRLMWRQCEPWIGNHEPMIEEAIDSNSQYLVCFLLSRDIPISEIFFNNHIEDLMADDDEQHMYTIHNIQNFKHITEEQWVRYYDAAINSEKPTHLKKLWELHPLVPNENITHHFTQLFQKTIVSDTLVHMLCFLASHHILAVKPFTNYPKYCRFRVELMECVHYDIDYETEPTHLEWLFLN